MKRVIKASSDLSHLFTVGQKVRCMMEDFESKSFFKGTVKEVYPDHIIVDIPGVSDHCWFDEDTIGDVYPEYNFPVLEAGDTKAYLAALPKFSEIEYETREGVKDFGRKLSEPVDKDDDPYANTAFAQRSEWLYGDDIHTCHFDRILDKAKSWKLRQR